MKFLSCPGKFAKVLLPVFVGSLIIAAASLAFAACAGKSNVSASFTEEQQQQRARRAAAKGATSINVKAGDDLQAAINRARPGDTLLLEAGATFHGSFKLPNKPAASSDAYITIRSAARDAQLPAPNERLVPARYGAQLPKLITEGEGAVVETTVGAHGYRFVGVEFTSATPYTYNLIALGSDRQKLADMPHHIVFDRCYVHAGAGVVRRGFALNSGAAEIINSHVAGFAGKQEETQAIAGWNGTGNWRIVNNYLEAATENLLIGGADPSILNLVPSDILIQGNYFTKRAAWRNADVSIKNLLELKNARRVRVEDNLFEYSYRGTAILFTVRNQGGRAAWSTIEDVTFTNNVVRHAQACVNILGRDDEHPSQQAHDIHIVNNLFDDIDQDHWGGDAAYFLQISDGRAIFIEHNTVRQTYNAITQYGAAATNFFFRNNIVAWNSYGIHISGKGFPDGVIRGNVFADTKSVGLSITDVPPDNFITKNFDTIGFVNPAGGNYALLPASRYKKRATDNTDPGCNMETLKAALQAKGDAS